MTAPDLSVWAVARSELGAAVPEDPQGLDRPTLGVVAEGLYSLGWSFGDISAATGIPKTTVYRWLIEPTDHREPQEGGGGWLVVGLVIAVGVGVFRWLRNGG